MKFNFSNMKSSAVSMLMVGLTRQQSPVRFNHVDRGLVREEAELICVGWLILVTARLVLTRDVMIACYTPLTPFSLCTLTPLTALTPFTRLTAACPLTPLTPLTLTRRT